MLDVLHDRPALWTGIKELSFLHHFQRYEDVYESPLNMGPSKKDTCGQIAKFMELKKLEWNVIFEPSLLQYFLRDHEKLLWVSDIRRLRVTRSFHVKLHIIPSIYPAVLGRQPVTVLAGDVVERIPGETKKEYQQRCTQRLEDALRPNSLRLKENSLDEMTEMERYMATRLQE